MLRLLCATLIALGLGLFAYRAFVLDFPLTPDTNSPVWAFEIQADLPQSDNGARVSMYVPPEFGRYQPLREQFLSERMSLSIRSDPDGSRRAIWTTAELETATSVYYRATFFMKPVLSADRPQTKPPRDLPSDFDLVSERSLEQRTLANRMMADLERQAYDDDTLTSLLIDRLRDGSDDLARQLLDGRVGTTPVAETAAYVLNQQGRAARAVHGIPLRETVREATPIAWLELWTGSEWRTYDIASGDPFNPEDRMTLWRGDGDIVSAEGATLSGVRIALTRRDVGAVQALAQRQGDAERPLALATLLDLPVNTQLVLQSLLVIPLGVLVLVFLRQFVGVPTFGTFMPVLIALAFRSATLTTGLIILAIILGVGMAFRLAFSKMNLLLVPRLASMLTVIIMVMIGVSVGADSYALGTGFSVTLFPIVILTMTIERLSVTLEESGALDASKEFVGSVVVAVLSYLVMAIPLLQHLFFLFPELLLVILAILLMMGRYSGFRLSELRRFHELDMRG
ncbi:UUP1 family membrane protein [Maribius pontilimi]|uniref:UUP1 family membrane protein n=1 Tax=Palleronia pontilimi TaxID=1964209 RepID=A0A934IGL6_9RHOB|nr:UUP1 family membrane protein [Palleronia pontilimi]MBJ3762523.1 UUP1 family membrane protein [Palleronia pontilimi]